MDLKNAEWEYDCGHGTDNKFSNLPEDEQRETREYFAKVDAWIEQKKHDPNIPPPVYGQ